ncbi:hypothetical protein H310_11707 [Aphanomyces invadans]|uniref:Uncharacterized protein n=1 Tax=Aphanomyces invadans TaxID=157072 RepID=A0A024TKR3_9STRA|nr:hypothetical protein H310_11707 [Aphanomyces invadans]ETV94745.1 hypothetical protein H310_11707 [Aphanomyces invadans]|eukprot:XP_008876690.1 hypothetical protein H310_11707 [Aphanomyces invadans]
MRPLPRVAAAVLCDRSLLQQIAGFQDGVFGNLLPLFALQRHLVCTLAGKRRNHVEVDVEVEFRGTAIHLSLSPFNCVWLEKALKHALLRGHAAWVRHVLRCKPNVSFPNLVDIAAQHGDIAMLEFLHMRKVRGSTEALDTAKSLEIVQYLHARDYSCTTAAMDIAALRGALDIVRFLHEHRREGCTVLAMDFAASNGHLDVIQFLHSHRREGCTAKALEMAIKRGHVDVVKFLLCHRHEHKSSSDVVRRASELVARHEPTMATLVPALVSVDAVV